MNVCVVKNLRWSQSNILNEVDQHGSRALFDKSGASRSPRIPNKGLGVTCNLLYLIQEHFQISTYTVTMGQRYISTLTTFLVLIVI